MKHTQNCFHYHLLFDLNLPLHHPLFQRFVGPIIPSPVNQHHIPQKCLQLFGLMPFLIDNLLKAR